MTTALNDHFPKKISNGTYYFLDLRENFLGKIHLAIYKETIKPKLL